jgi:hypothetical protein
MKKDCTDITIVLDRSGSMQAIKDDTIGGFNSFLKAQQDVPGEATLTLAQFDHEYEVVYQGVNLKDARPLDSSTFVPRGVTALLDAIGRTIIDTGARLAAMPEVERPEKVVFVILTDGHENSSKEFRIERINEMITHQREAYKWEFVFLGANQDAIATASQMGIGANAALTFAANSQGTSRLYHSLSQNVANYRTGQSRGVAFSDEDREAQSKATWQDN